MTVSDVWDLLAQNQVVVLVALAGLVVALLWAGDIIRPDSLARSGVRDVSGYPSALWLFAGVIVFITLMLSHQFVSEQEWFLNPPQGQANTVLREPALIALGAYFLSGVVAIGMVVVFARAAGNAGLMPAAGDLPIGIGCLLLALPLIKLTGDLLALMHQEISGAAPPTIAHPTLDLILGAPSDPWRWGIIAAAVIGAPFVEEIIYRVFLQSAVLRWTGQPLWSVLVAAGVFAGAHALGEEGLAYYAVGPIFVLGVAMGVAYERTRRVGVPIVMHMGFNALNVAWAMYEGQPAGAPAA